MTDLTPAAVKAEIGLIKRFIVKYFAGQRKEIFGIHTNYSNFFASSKAEHFTNGGEPVAYIIFTTARFADGTAITPAEITAAVDYVRAALPETDQLPMECFAEAKKVKVRTAGLYDESSVKRRPSKIVDPVPETAAETVTQAGQ